MDFDFKEILKFSFFEPFKQKETPKYFLGWSIFLLALSILEGGVLYFIFQPAVNNPGISVAAIISLAIYAVLFLLVFGLITSVTSVFFGYFIITLALKTKGKKSEKFTLLRGIKLLLLGIGVILASLFSIFKPKLDRKSTRLNSSH